jgi:phosphatidylserine synthase
MSDEDSTFKEKPERSKRDGPPWIAGGVLVMIGVLLLASNLTGASFDNWWALFILIPAFGSLYVALVNYNEAGGMTQSVRKPLTGGIILLLVCIMFLFELPWGTLWPFLLIIAGGTMLVTAMWPSRS